MDDIHIPYCRLGDFSYKLIPERITFQNYVRAWTFPSNFDEAVTLGTFFLNSVLVTALITGPALIVDSLAGYVLARRDIPGKNLLFTWLWLP